MEKAREKYGPLIGLKMATQNTVLFCGPQQVLDALKLDVFQDRPKKIAIASNNAKKGTVCLI